MYACVCVQLRLLIASGIIWTQHDWLNKFHNFYIHVSRRTNEELAWAINSFG